MESLVGKTKRIYARTHKRRPAGDDSGGIFGDLEVITLSLLI